MSNARTLASLIDGSNIVVPSGYGLDFSANANASGMTSEVLDDYEEGTWTPNISGSNGQPITETNAIGYYTKIGNTIHAWFTVICSDNVGDTNFQLLYGLPFTPNSNLGYGLTGVAYLKTGSTGAGVTASIKVSTNYSFIFSHRDSAGTVTTASAYDRVDGYTTYTVS